MCVCMCLLGGRMGVLGGSVCVCVCVCFYMYTLFFPGDLAEKLWGARGWWENGGLMRTHFCGELLGFGRKWQSLYIVFLEHHQIRSKQLQAPRSKIVTRIIIIQGRWKELRSAMFQEEKLCSSHMHQEWTNSQASLGAHFSCQHLQNAPQ